MRQMLRHAAAALTACGLMALAIAGTDTGWPPFHGHGQRRPAVLGRAKADGGTVTDTPDF